MVQFPQKSEQMLIFMCFIHSRLSRLHFSLKRNTVNHRDIQLLFFFNKNRCQFLMNVYSNSLHTTMDFLSNKALNIPNLLYIGGNFNIRDTEWDISVSSHPTTSQVLRDLAKFNSLVCSIPVLYVQYFMFLLIIQTFKTMLTH